MGSDNQKMTRDSFLQKARDVHGERYLYDNFNFVDRKIKSLITCRVHGDFEMTPKYHVRGQGCKECGRIKVNRAKRITQEEWVKRFKLQHSDNYTYEFNSEGRVLAHDFVTVTCKVHGAYKAKAYAISQGSGCRECRNKVNGINKRNTTSEFIERAKQVHGNRYSYDCTEYVHTKIRVKVRCRVHGIYECLSTEHLYGSNCMECSRVYQKRKSIARGSWLNEKYFKLNPEVKQLPYRLYLLKMNEEEGDFLKVGITTNVFIPKRDRIKLLRRMCYKRDNFQSLIVLEGNHYECWKNEQDILERYSNYRYQTQEEFAGHTECLSIECLQDILNDFKQLKEKHNARAND